MGSMISQWIVHIDWLQGDHYQRAKQDGNHNAKKDAVGITGVPFARYDILTTYGNFGEEMNELLYS